MLHLGKLVSLLVVGKEEKKDRERDVEPDS